MKKFIIFCFITIITCGYYSTSSATTTNVSKGTRFITLKDVTYADRIEDFSSGKTKTLPNRTHLIVDIPGSGNTFSRVRIVKDGGNGALNGKFVWVRTIHLKTLCMKN